MARRQDGTPLQRRSSSTIAGGAYDVTKRNTRETGGQQKPRGRRARSLTPHIDRGWVPYRQPLFILSSSTSIIIFRGCRFTTNLINFRGCKQAQTIHNTIFFFRCRGISFGATTCPARSSTSTRGHLHRFSHLPRATTNYTILGHLLRIAHLPGEIFSPIYTTIYLGSNHWRSAIIICDNMYFSLQASKDNPASGVRVC